MARAPKRGAAIPTVVEAIVADPDLNDDQRDILIGLYDRMINGEDVAHNPIEAKRLIPLSDVCPLLGVSLRTGYRWVEDGDFPVPEVRIGTKIMFRPADVDAFLAGR